MPELPVQNAITLTAEAGGVDLDTGGRSNVEIFVTSDGAADFNLWGADDGRAWRLLVEDFISLSAAGNRHRGYKSAYRWVNVGTATIGNHFIEIVAGGA